MILFYSILFDSLLNEKPNYRYTTNIVTNASVIKGHVLKGDLLINFNLDPSFTTDDLKALLLSLRAYGVNKIAGHVYIHSNSYTNIIVFIVSIS